MISILAALPLLLFPAAPQQGQGAGGVPMIQDLGPAWKLTFDETENGMNLEQFIKICQQRTDINFTYSNETGRLLQDLKVRMFGSKVVQKEDFYSFFQIIMIINRFVCTRIGPENLSVVVVASLDSPARASIKQDAVYISPDEIEAYADQPATMVQTVLHLPNMDLRAMGANMRQLVVDPNTLQMIPINESHSVIVTGFGSNVASLAKMLTLIDKVSEPEPPVLPRFEVIRLEHASADELADTLEELLEARQRAATNGGRPNAAGATGQISAGTVETKIMVQPRTNSLLIMAMPEDMPAIMELIARLDIDHVEREQNFHFIALENADAEDLADVLSEFLTDSSRVRTSAAGGQNRQAGAGGGSAASANDEVAVVPDASTNSLLIAASRARYDEILNLIELLDQPQDQVLIETALIELTGSDVRDIGVELGGADLPNSDQTGSFGVTSFGLSAFTDSDGDGIPDVRVPNLTSGVTAGIIEGSGFSLPVLVAAIQERRDANILNIPSVLVNNNSAATVRTLNEQPTTTITATGQGQTQETFNEYVEAGITLQISPAISASRYLRLNISLEVSSFQGSFSGSIPPPKVTRTLTTVVNVPDGDTMVIGGIIVDDNTSESSKVPWLGDIPIIGWLFRRDSDTNTKTTLYFFVTPHIMHDREFADLAEYSYKKKKEAADTIGTGRVRMIDPEFESEQDVENLLDGLKLPVYQAPAKGEVDQSHLGIDGDKANSMSDQDN